MTSVRLSSKRLSACHTLEPMVRAGLGEVVLYATGSSARQTVMTDRRPCDAVIMAIVDQWEVAGEVKYHKGEEARTTR